MPLYQQSKYIILKFNKNKCLSTYTEISEISKFPNYESQNISLAISIVCTDLILIQKIEKNNKYISMKYWNLLKKRWFEFFVYFNRTRRLSWMSARNTQREKLEGSLLTVCVDCKEMVVQVNQLETALCLITASTNFYFIFQVICVSRSSKRHSRAEFSSISPDTVRDLR